jgi:hypothetical protein
VHCLYLIYEKENRDGKMDIITLAMLVHYYVINNSTAMNVTSLPGLMSYENSALNGLFGAGILITIFIIIMVSLSYIIDFLNGVMIASFISLGLSLVMALPGIAIVSPTVIYLFGSILGLSALGNLLRGVWSTW